MLASRLDTMIFVTLKSLIRKVGKYVDDLTSKKNLMAKNISQFFLQNENKKRLSNLFDDFEDSDVSGDFYIHINAYSQKRSRSSFSSSRRDWVSMEDGKLGKEGKKS